MTRTLLISLFFVAVTAWPVVAAGEPGPPKFTPEQDTLTSLSSLKLCLGAFYLDNRAYPTTAGAEAEVGFLKQSFWPIYIRWFPSVDGWNSFWSYRSDGERYLLISAGANGQLDGTYALDGANVAAGDDILLIDGRLEARPDILEYLRTVKLIGSAENPWAE